MISLGLNKFLGDALLSDDFSSKWLKSAKSWTLQCWNVTASFDHVSWNVEWQVGSNLGSQSGNVVIISYSTEAMTAIDQLNVKLYLTVIC